MELRGGERWEILIEIEFVGCGIGVEERGGVRGCDEMGVDGVYVVVCGGGRIYDLIWNLNKRERESGLIWEESMFFVIFFLC